MLMEKERSKSMSKELSPLEALNDLIDYLEDEHLGLSEEERVIERKQIIETALNEYEIMRQTKFFAADEKISDEDLEKLKNQRMIVISAEQCELKPLFDEETQKKLKALEIIKNKHLINLTFADDFDVFLERNNLTETEFNLLKEYFK